MKDSKVVIFYSNDLSGTLHVEVMDENNADAIQLVHGLSPLYCWTGSDIMNRKIFQLPTVIVAYNIYVNAVNQMDKLQSTNTTWRKELR